MKSGSVLGMTGRFIATGGLTGTGVAVGVGTGVGAGVAVGLGVAVGAGVAVGLGVVVGVGVAVSVWTLTEGVPNSLVTIFEHAVKQTRINVRAIAGWGRVPPGRHLFMFFLFSFFLNPM
jgi:hypothetical protein